VATGPQVAFPPVSRPPPQAARTCRVTPRLSVSCLRATSPAREDARTRSRLKQPSFERCGSALDCRYIDEMRRWTVLFLVALSSVVVAAPSGKAGRPSAAQTKTQAEVNVLRDVARRWKAWRRFGLFDARTHLLTDNTEGVCHGRGRPRVGNRYLRFVCVVRPHDHHGREGLWLRYRALAGGRFRVRFLAYHRR
jgi:hypothetical protein